MQGDFEAFLSATLQGDLPRLLCLYEKRAGRRGLHGGCFCESNIL